MVQPATASVVAGFRFGEREKEVRLVRGSQAAGWRHATQTKGAHVVKRIALVLAVAMVMAVFGSGIAAADPINSKNAEVFQITCENGQTFEVVVVAGLPAHIVGSSRNIIPVEFTFTATNPDTGEVLFSDTAPIGQGNRVGLQDDLITCTAGPFTEFVPELGQEVTFFVEVEAFLTPRGR